MNILSAHGIEYPGDPLNARVDKGNCYKCKEKDVLIEQDPGDNNMYCLKCWKQFDPDFLD